MSNNQDQMTAPIDLEALRRLAETAATLPDALQPFVSISGQVVIQTFSMGSTEQLYVVANYYDAASPAAILALIAEVEQSRAQQGQVVAVVKWHNFGADGYLVFAGDTLEQIAPDTKLYAHPDPEAVTLRAKVAQLEAQLACVARITAERRGEVVPSSDDRIVDLLRELGCGGLDVTKGGKYELPYRMG